MPHSGRSTCREVADRFSLEPRPATRGWRPAMGEDLRELLHVTRGEVLRMPPLIAVMQARDDPGAQQVDLAVQDAPRGNDPPLDLRARVDRFCARSSSTVGARRVGVVPRRRCGLASPASETVSSSGTCVSSSSETIAGSDVDGALATQPSDRRVCSLRRTSMRPCWRAAWRRGRRARHAIFRLGLGKRVGDGGASRSGRRSARSGESQPFRGPSTWG